MHLRTIARILVAFALVAAVGFSQERLTAAAGMTHVTGRLLTPAGQSAAGVWVCLQTCPAATSTDANGNFSVDVPDIGTTWLFVYVDGGDRGVGGTQIGAQGPVAISGANYALPTFTLSQTPRGGGGACPPMPPARAGSPIQTTYLPNITKTFGGPQGWVTPFIVQNTGIDPGGSTGVSTDLQIDFFKFSDGSLAARRIVTALKPGTSFADVPNADCDLTDFTQYSVVVRSFNAKVVAVVNEQQGAGSRAEAGSYVGTSVGATSVFLPNVVKTFFGFQSPFIMQNLGASPTVATASFVSFDGTKTATIQRSIAPGQSQYIIPNDEPGLAGGTQYAVTVTSAQPISVVVNTHKDAADDPKPFMYSTNGLAQGAGTLYGPYAVKNVPGVGKGVSTIVVQNMGASSVTPSIAFTPLGGGTATMFTGSSIGQGKSWVFDTRLVNGGPQVTFCGAAASAGCLADGEYSFVISGGGQLAAVVNVIGDTTADGYGAIATTASKVYLPNLTRTLGGVDGWSTPFLVQSAGATNVTLSWYRFSDGSLVTTQNLSLSANTATRVDPRTVGALADNTQYSVVVDGNGAPVAAIVTELNFQGGDGAMFYGGIPAP